MNTLNDSILHIIKNIYFFKYFKKLLHFLLIKTIFCVYGYVNFTLPDGKHLYLFLHQGEGQWSLNILIWNDLFRTPHVFIVPIFRA